MTQSAGFARDGQLQLDTEKAGAMQSSSIVGRKLGDSVTPGWLQAVGSTEQLQGFADLKPEEQQTVAAAVGGSLAPAAAASPAQAPLAAPGCAPAAATPESNLSAVLLHHLPLLDTLLQDARSICSLMCTSKELMALLRSTCAGRLALVFEARDSAHELQLAQWLAGSRSGGCELLAGHAELRLLRKVTHDEGGWVEVSNQDAAAGAGWEDGEGQIQNQNQGKDDAATSSGCLLHSLQAATQVTSLALKRDCYKGLEACGSAVRALAGLTCLCSITLSSWDFGVCPAPLFEALQGLTRLTSLTVSRVTGTSKLRHLPQSLLALELGVCSPGICLSHLTQLTALRTDKLFSLESGDLLPASLRHLETGEINSVQRLVGLTALRSLSAYASNVPQRRLQRVAGSLSQLTRVQLCYRSGANDAAAAWPLLPLQHLELREQDALASGMLQLATLRHISCLSQLTYLHIQRLDCVQADTWEVASVLRSMGQLRGLRLWAAGPWLQRRGQQQQRQQHAEPAAAAIGKTLGMLPGAGRHPDPGYPALLMQQRTVEHEQEQAADSSGGISAADSAGAVAFDEPSKAGLTGAIAALPLLSSLSLSLQGLGSAAAAELGAATGLTSLKLRACGVGSAALAQLAADLTGLRSLFVEYNREVDDDVLPVLLHELTALTELDVRYTGVSSAGRQHLQQVTRLQQLQL